MASVNPEPIGSIEYRTRDGHEGKIEIGGQQEIQFGRGSSCSVVIRGVHASAKHFSVYAIIPDPDHVQEIPPLVYCQDRSSVGTYINKRLVKPKSAILLQDGWSIIIRKELQSCFLQAQPNPRIFSSKLMRREMKVRDTSRT